MTDRSLATSPLCTSPCLILAAMTILVGNIIAHGAEPTPIVVPTASIPRPATAPFGVNIEGIGDYARSMTFVDAMKAARTYGSPETPWDEKAAVDADGWPMGDAGTVVFADVPVPAGDYSFSCEGRCTIVTPASTATVRSLAYHRTSNTTTATIAVGAGADHLYLGFKNTRGGVKHIRLLHPGYPLTTDKVFTKELLAAIKPFAAIRMMDFTRTNGSPVITWNDRAKITDARQSTPRGAAWEYAIMLANDIGKDLWINIPDQADDDYVRQLATLLKEKLNKDRNVYLEYSNEVWNGSFAQFGRNMEAAKKEIDAGEKTLNDNGHDDNKYYWGWKRVSKRLLEIAAIFGDVWGKEAINTRIRPVLASQSANPFMARMQVEYIAKYHGAPSHFIYGVAGAPYLNIGPVLQDRDGLTIGDIFSKGFPTGMADVRRNVMDYQMIATYYRLHSMCYEGAVAMEGEHSLPVKLAATRDPRIGKTLDDYLNTWYATGGDLFMYYCLAGANTKFGTWGLTDDLHKRTPKLEAAHHIADHPAAAVTAGMPIPGIITAANYGAANGEYHGGDMAHPILARLGNGAWADYLLNVQQAGTYALTLQHAGKTDAEVELLLSGQSLEKVTCPATTEDESETRTSSTPVLVQLEPGLLVLRINVLKAGLTVQSITFEKR